MSNDTSESSAPACHIALNRSSRTPSARRRPPRTRSGPGVDVAALVHAAASGDEKAWNELYRRYDGLVRATASGLGLNRADVADVSQTTWMRLLGHLGRLRDAERVGGWLATTARHEGLRLLQKAKREVTSTDDDEFDVAPVDQQAVDAELLASEREAALRDALSDLPERCQSIVHYLIVEPASYAEVSAKLGIPVGSLGPTRARCLQSLRRKSQLWALAS